MLRFLQWLLILMRISPPSDPGFLGFFFIKPELFELGRTKLTTPFGNQVPCYDLERTICDVIRSRNKMGTETFLAALKQYAASPKKNLNRLNAYAKKMSLTNVVRQYLQVLL